MKNNIGKIISYNRRANRALEERRLSSAEKWLLNIHKLEINDRVPLGEYRLKDI